MGHWIAWGTLFINIWHRFEFESVHMWRLFSTSHAYAQLQFEILNGAQVRYAYAMNWAQVRYVIHISGFQSILISHLAWQNHLTLIKYYFMHHSTVSNFQLLKIMSESSVCSFIQKTNDEGRNCREQKEKENQWNITFLRKNSCTNPFTCFIGWNLGCAIIMHITTELQAEVRSSQIVNNS